MYFLLNQGWLYCLLMQYTLQASLTISILILCKIWKKTRNTLPSFVIEPYNTILPKKIEPYNTILPKKKTILHQRQTYLLVVQKYWPPLGFLFNEVASRNLIFSATDKNLYIKSIWIPRVSDGNELGIGQIWPIFIPTSQLKTLYSYLYCSYLGSDWIGLSRDAGWIRNLLKEILF